MGVALNVGAVRFEVGASSFLCAFFSTIFVRLEGESWGSRFPALMRELYSGRLASDRSATALEELRKVRVELANLPPSSVVWNYEDRAQQPPWGAAISPTITSLANYFWTSDGKPFLDILEEGLRESQRQGMPLEIR